MKKINMVKTVLPCKSLDGVLYVKRDTKVQEVIDAAQKEYAVAYGSSLQNVTSFTCIDARVIMSMYQLPDATLDKIKDFGAFVKDRGT